MKKKNKALKAGQRRCAKSCAKIRVLKKGFKYLKGGKIVKVGRKS